MRNVLLTSILKWLMCTHIPDKYIGKLRLVGSILYRIYKQCNYLNGFRDDFTDQKKIKLKVNKRMMGAFHIVCMYNMLTLHYRYIINVKEERSDTAFTRSLAFFDIFLQFCQTNDFTFIHFQRRFSTYMLTFCVHLYLPN